MKNLVVTTVLCSGAIYALLVACKPIVRQEPVSREYSLATFNRLLAALKILDYTKASRIIFTEQERLSVIRHLVYDASLKHPKEIARAIKNHRIMLPPAADIDKHIAMLRHSNSSTEFVIELAKLRNMVKDTHLEFDKLDKAIASFDFASHAGVNAYKEKRVYLQTAFAEWAVPLRQRIIVETQHFLDNKISDTLSPLDALRTADEIEKESHAIIKILDNRFE